MTSPSKKHNALVNRYTNKSLAQWLSAPAKDADLAMMRELMLQTMQMGRETFDAKSTPAMAQKGWELDYQTRAGEDYHLKLSFTAMSNGKGKTDTAGFQFKVAQGKRYIMTGYDSVDSGKSSHAVSVADKVALAPLLAETQENKPTVQRKVAGLKGQQGPG